MAATDSRPVPRKNVAYRVYFPILDADGDLVTGAASLDSEVSIDGAAFADCTNEATEIGSTGLYYLDLTSGEMNGDAVVVQVKTATSGAKTTPIIFYPEEAGDFRADVTHFGGTAGTFASGRPEVNASHAAGTAWGSGAITAASIAADAITAAKIADGAIDAATFAAGAINAAAIAADAITDAKVASDVTIASVTGAVGSVTGAVGSVTGAVGSVTGNVGGNVTGSVGSVAAGGISSASFAAGAITASAIAADAIGASELAADAVAEIADAVWDEVLSGHLTGGTTGAGLNAAGSAGDPWSTALPGAYSAGSAGKIVGDNLNTTVSSRLATSGYTAPLDAAGTRTAVGLASANLDTQLTAIYDAVDTEVASVLAAVDTEVAAIKAKTDNLPADPADASDIAALLATITGYIDTEVAAILAAVDTEVGAIKTVTDQLVAAQSEPSAVPAANATPLAKLAWLAALARNKVTQTATTQTVYADDGTTAIAASTVSDDATTYVRGEFA